MMYPYLKVYLNGSDAAKFEAIKKKLGYSNSSEILRMLILNLIRENGKHCTEVVPNIYGDGIDLEEDGLNTKQAKNATTGKRVKKPPKSKKAAGTPTQIKTHLTEKEAADLNDIRKIYGFRSVYQIGKVLMAAFIKSHEKPDKETLNYSLVRVVKVKKKRQK